MLKREKPSDDDRKLLKPAAQRALQEAEERRRLADMRKAEEGAKDPEIWGRGGLDPVRYGDWEKNGIASDF
jgi:hypothetical protein